MADRPGKHEAAGDGGTQALLDALPGGLGARVLQGGGDDSYAEGARIMLRVVTLLTAALCLAIGAFLYLVKTEQVQDRYFAMSFDGKTVPMGVMGGPGLNNNAILSWVTQVSAEVMTFGFNDYAKRLAESKKYFTAVGWESFYAAINKSRLLKNINFQQQLMTAIPAGAPVLVYEGLRGGEYVWDVRVPLVLTIRAGASSMSARPSLIVTVIRVPTRESPSGIGIQQWRMM